MSSSTRFFAVILLTLLCIPASLRAQSSTKTATKTARGSVSGRVTIEDKPAVGVTVGLRPATAMMPLEKFYKGVTDQEGVYRITNVPAGNYEIAPAAPAYVAADALSPRGKNVIVGEDENVEDINFSLVRGGVITGKVTDAEGRPVIQQQVNLYRAADFLQQPLRQVFNAGNVQTDDRGIYRFFGLAAGRYKIAAGRGDDIYAGNFNMSSRVVYKQVFHPDVTDQTKSPIIEVREGSEATGVDITLGAPAQTFTVSGRVIDREKGLPVPNVRFTFQRNTGERFEMANTQAVSNNRGDFIAEGLIPGKYSVVLFGNQEQDVRVETLSFDVLDQDVTDLTIKLTKGLSVSGVVVLETEDKTVLTRLRELQLRGYVTAAPGSGTVGSSTWSAIAPDGAFRLAGLSPGKLNFWLTSQNLTRPKGFTITRVEHNGAVMPIGVEVKEGDPLTDVRVFVSYGNSTLRGTVAVENGSMPETGRMFVRLGRLGTPPIANAPVDARGQFLLEGIPAGVYEVTVSVMLPNARAPINVKREVTVLDGVANEVFLTLDLTPAPPPKP